MLRSSARLLAVSPSNFFNGMKTEEINFFAGVPDSLLKDFCAYVTDHSKPTEHIIAANEGTAVGLAAGYHLATGKIPCVYAQNSGFANMLNPLMSLAHPRVYSIPMILLIGWRGEPGVKDEPQHKLMGDCQEAMLKAVQIDYDILPQEDSAAIECLKSAVYSAKRKSAPVVLLAKSGTFEKYKLKPSNEIINYEMSRENALGIITENSPSNAIFVGSTGVLSRELYEIRDEKFNGDHSTDFLCVGNMGHAGALAAGIAANTEKPVVCLDGDGAMLMHMGSLGNSGMMKRKNFLHICINNGLHESVGGQPTVGFDVDFVAIAKACGYEQSLRVDSESDLRKKLQGIFLLKGPVFLEVRVKPGVRLNLGRPKTTPEQSKKVFMDRLSQNE